MSPLEIILTLAILAGLGFWFRGYFVSIRRTFLRWRQLIAQAQRLRRTFTSGGNGSGFGPQVQAREKVVDVAGRAPERRSVTPQHRTDAAPRNAPELTQCPACGDTLNEAQVRALQAKSVRCPGSNRVGQTCPFYGERLLN